MVFLDSGNGGLDSTGGAIGIGYGRGRWGSVIYSFSAGVPTVSEDAAALLPAGSSPMVSYSRSRRRIPLM